MKTFDIKSDINPETYQDEYLLTISEGKHKNSLKLQTDELLNLYDEVKHAVETTIV